MPNSAVVSFRTLPEEESERLLRLASDFVDRHSSEVNKDLVVAKGKLLAVVFWGSEPAVEFVTEELRAAFQQWDEASPTVESSAAASSWISAATN